MDIDEEEMQHHLEILDKEFKVHDGLVDDSTLYTIAPGYSDPNTQMFKENNLSTVSRAGGYLPSMTWARDLSYAFAGILDSV